MKTFRTQTRHPFSVGPWRVFPAQRQLIQGDRTVTLGPVQMNLLRYLAAHAGEDVTPEAIRSAFEEEDEITAATLPRLMTDLAEILNDAPPHTPLLEISENGGYRLVAPVAFSDPVLDRSAEPKVVMVQGKGHLFTHLPPVGAPEGEVPTTRRWPRWPPPLAFACMLVLVGLAFFYTKQRQEQARFAARSAFPQTVALVETAPVEAGAALSPDGTALAFVRQTADGTAHLYVRSVAGGTPQQLTHGTTYDAQPAWSPDGAQLAFLRYASAQSASCSIYRLEISTGDEAQVAECGRKPLADLAWSPDGQALVFSEQPAPDAPSHLVALTLETGERTVLTDPPGGITGDTGPAFSPDGRWIAFTRHQHTASADVFLVSVTGSATRRLTHFGRPLYGVDWAPDGQSLIYATEPLGQAQLWRLPLERGRARMIPTSRGADARYPQIARETGQLVYQQQPRRIELWEAALEPDAPPSPWLPEAARDHQPVFAPADDRLAFVSFRSGWSELWLYDPASEAPVDLTDFGGRWVNVPKWSPDGQRLLFSATGQEGFSLYTIDAEGGEPTRLALDAGNVRAPSWSHDGAWIYYGSDEGGTWEVWRMAATGKGTPEQVTHNGGRVAQEDAAGRWLYYTKTDQTGLWRMALPDGKEEHILDTLQPADLANWQLTDGGIYFVQRLADGTSPVFFLDLGTRQVTKRFTPPRPLPGTLPAFSVSADGRRIVFTQAVPLPGEIRLMEALP